MVYQLRLLSVLLWRRDHTIVDPNHLDNFNKEFEFLDIAFRVAKCVWISKRVAVTIEGLLALFRSFWRTKFDGFEGGPLDGINLFVNANRKVAEVVGDFGRINRR